MKKIVIFLFFILLIVLLKYFAISEYLSFESIKENKDFLIKFSTDNSFLFIFAFILSYILVVLFQVPGATILTLRDVSTLSGTLLKQMLRMHSSSLEDTEVRRQYTPALCQNVIDLFNFLDAYWDLPDAASDLPTSHARCALKLLLVAWHGFSTSSRSTKFSKLYSNL